MYPFKLIQLNSITNTIIILLSFTFLFSCTRDKNEANLNKEDLTTISTIIPLDKNETIELFETNGGFNGLKTSGNLITNKRIASYWLDVKTMKFTQLNTNTLTQYTPRIIQKH